MKNNDKLLAFMEPRLKEFGFGVEPYGVQSLYWRVIGDVRQQIVMSAVSLRRGRPTEVHCRFSVYSGRIARIVKHESSVDTEDWGITGRLVWPDLPRRYDESRDLLFDLAAWPASRELEQQYLLRLWTAIEDIGIAILNETRSLEGMVEYSLRGGGLEALYLAVACALLERKAEARAVLMSALDVHGVREVEIQPLRGFEWELRALERVLRRWPDMRFPELEEWMTRVSEAMGEAG